MDDDRKAFLKEMIAKRGYALDYHQVLVAEDFPFIRALDGLLEAAYTNPRRLDRKTKELIFTAVLTVLGAGKEHIMGHIKVAAREGATKEEVLEVLELCVLPAGVPKFMLGYEAWKECFPVQRLEVE